MRITGPLAPTNPFHLARAYGVGRAHPPGPEPAGAARPALAASRLVAAVVPGGVSFDAGPARSGSLQLYRHPADRNVAATGVGLGRVVDVRG